ncbi:MAG: AMP-dependent synthetase [Ruminococcaceae bacterium]|nr:AMP-dependent synthetase [Oscillospiraceae bacterium]
MANSKAVSSKRNKKTGYYVTEPVISIKQMLKKAKDEAGDWNAYRYKVSEDEIKDVTFNEFYQNTEDLGASLCKLGLGNTHIACVGDNSYPWIVAYLTVLKSAGVFVPIDKELPEDDMLRIINDSDSTAIFFASRFEESILGNKDKLPNIKYFISLDREVSNDECLSMRQLIAEGADIDKTEYDSLKSDENDLKLLVYTSGTTGIAKGVMLSEHNLISGVYYGLHVSQVFGTGLSVLPYNHTYEAVCDILVAIHKHTTLCINDSLKAVLKNLQLFKPDYIYIVPAFLELFYAGVQKNIRKQGKEKLVNNMIGISNGLRKVGIDLRKVFFKQITDAFGGNLRKIVCGGAPIRPEIGKFFGDIGIWVIGGYGITECSPLVSVNDEKANDYNTVGRRLPCLEWRVDSPNEEGIGEIQVKGDVVMLGYYKQPEKTDEVLKDGWFSTGDYGYITPQDWLVITGRKKNIIVLTNGKNIYPEEIENLIMQIDYVSEVIVSGIKNEHGQETGLQAEVYLADEHSEEQVLDDIQNKLEALPGYKNISKVVIRDEPFAKTTSNKIKRKY